MTNTDEIFGLSDVEVAWIAGLCEGEAWFGVNKNRRNGTVSCTPTIVVQMVDEDVIKKLGDLVPRARTYSYPPYGTGRQSTYKWTLYRQARELMRLLRPHMGARRKAAIDRVLAMPSKYKGVV